MRDYFILSFFLQITKQNVQKPFHLVSPYSYWGGRGGTKCTATFFFWKHGGKHFAEHFACKMFSKMLTAIALRAIAQRADGKS